MWFCVKVFLLKYKWNALQNRWLGCQFLYINKIYRKIDLYQQDLWQLIWGEPASWIVPNTTKVGAVTSVTWNSFESVSSTELVVAKPDSTSEMSEVQAKIERQNRIIKNSLMFKDIKKGLSVVPRSLMILVLNWIAYSAESLDSMISAAPSSVFFFFR